MISSMDRNLDLIIIENDSFIDDRGQLFTTFKSQYLNDLKFNHDKYAVSNFSVLRGLHGDPYAYKYITCVYGKIQLVVVDFRSDSQNYLKYQSFIIDGNDSKKISILAPPMFVTGHLVLSDLAVYSYKLSYSGDYPDVSDQYTVRYNDPKINIKWMIDEPILSERDMNCKLL